MIRTTVLGHTIRVDDIQNAKIKRVLIRAVRQTDICIFSDRHTDHTERYGDDHTHTDKYGDYSDHDQCTTHYG